VFLIIVRTADTNRDNTARQFRDYNTHSGQKNYICPLFLFIDRSNET